MHFMGWEIRYILSHLHFHISGTYLCCEFYQLQSLYSIKSHMITYTVLRVAGMAY